MLFSIRKSVVAIYLLAVVSGHAQQNLARPKLVVGIVVDQMRWDYLYRYYNRYQNNGGFKRLLNKGFSCENTFIPYAPTVTACGHTCIYTGTVPAINGIVGNNWWNKELNKDVYCTQDNNVKTVGSNSDQGNQSPHNLLTTTVCDELTLATNGSSKVVGVCIKDRGSVLPAGHSAKLVFWYDSKTGKFISSTYYMNELPKWVQDFNNLNKVDSFYKKGWNTLYPINTYLQSTSDNKAYEAKSFGSKSNTFPYEFNDLIGKSYGAIASTPFGNTLSIDMARAAIEGENLGKNKETDFLALSLSSTDYVGHAFGPNSIEIEDTYLRLDKELGKFFTYLDSKIGIGSYLIFLSADHGAAHVPGFLEEFKIPGGSLEMRALVKDVNKQLKEKYNIDTLVTNGYNYQFYLNDNKIKIANLNKVEIKNFIIDYVQSKGVVQNIFDLDKINETPIPERMKQMFINGYMQSRCGDLQLVFKPGYIDHGNTGTTHGLWSPYDAHIPLLFYGWNIKPGRLYRETYMTDIAPTIAALLRIQMPSGSIGKVIDEVFAK